jgi:hypothetical protein
LAHDFSIIFFAEINLREDSEKNVISVFGIPYPKSLQKYKRPNYNPKVENKSQFSTYKIPINHILKMLGWPEMKNVAGDGIAGDGECRRWIGKGELEKKKKKERKKPAGGVREVREKKEKKKKIGCFVLILFFLKW